MHAYGQSQDEPGAFRPLLMLAVTALLLNACTSPKPPKAPLRAGYSLPKRTMIRITHVNPQTARQELMLRSMSLIGTPYRYGGASRENGFDCSGMVQYVYQDALHVALPRTARDMAASSRKISVAELKVGDLVFFNTGAPYSHVGLYIGNGEFLHAPSSNASIRTARLDDGYFKSRFIEARSFF